MPAAPATGPDLRAWRLRLGWTQARAAAELRILVPSLRNLESGRREASGTLLRLAELLEQLHGPAAVAPSPEAAPRPPAEDAADRLVREVAVVVDDLGLAVAPDAVPLLAAEVGRLRRLRPGPRSPVIDVDAELVRAAREHAWRAAAGPGAPGLAEAAALVLGMFGSAP